MKQKLQIDILKEHSLEKSYATLTIGGGFALEEFSYKKGNVETFQSNLAFFFVLFQLLKNCSEFEKVSFEVQPSLAIISLQENEKDLFVKLIRILKMLYDKGFSEAEWENAKEFCFKEFKTSLTKSSSKALLKMMEFTNVNKNFSLKKLLSSYEELDYDLFEKQRKQIINLSNMSLFIYSNKDEEIVNSLRALNLGFLPSYDDFQWVCKPVDPYLLKDAHIVNPGHESFKFIGIDVCSGKKNGDFASKLYTADIFSNIIDSFQAMVHFDAFDTSILVQGHDGKFVQKKLEFPNVHSFQEAKLSCQKKYCLLALEQPESFCCLCAQRRYWGLYMPAYLKKFLEISYEEFGEIIQKSDIFFKEGEVLIVEGVTI